MAALSTCRALAGITTHAGRRLSHEIGRRAKASIQNHVGFGSSSHLLLDLGRPLLLIPWIFARCFTQEESGHAGNHAGSG